MKKIIIILFIFLITGCYDYRELNDLSFISAIAVDYDKENKEYLVSFEMLNDNKNGDGSAMNKSYVISSNGKDISKAFDNVSTKVNKIPYFYHLNALIISEDINKNKLKEVIDYILRNPEIKNEFYLILAKDVSAKTIISKSSDENKVVGEQIVKMIKSNAYENHITYDKNFEDDMEIFLDKYLSIPINSFTINENDLDIEGLAIYKDYELITYLSKEESMIFNMLNNNDSNFILSNQYNNKIISLNVYLNNTKINIKNDDIIINNYATSELKNNTTDMNLKDEKSYELLNKDFSKILNEKVINFIKKLQNKKIDILKINNIYYQKNKTKKDIFSEYNIKVNTKLVIDKKGLIFKIAHE